MLKRFFKIAIVLVALLLSNEGMAQIDGGSPGKAEQPPPPGGGPVGPTLPIPGLPFILVAGLAYGCYQIKDKE